MKLFKNRLKSAFFIAIGLFILLPFSNCSKDGGITLNKKSLSSQSSSSASSPVAVPTLTFLSKIPDLVNTTPVSATFDVQLNGGVLSTLMCQLNTQIPFDCSSRSVSFVSIADGDYTLKIVATLTNGLKSELVGMFRKDSTAPAIAVSMTPATLSGMTSASFIFNVNDALSGVNTIECALDAGAYAACVSPYNLMNLSAGAHQVKIRSSDKAGNMSSVYSYSWNIDTSVPTVTLSAKPNSVTNMNTASFSFTSGSIGASFQCKLDGAALANCTSPISYSALASQSHTFSVQAKDMLGNFSALTSYTWVVDTVAPSLPVVTSSASALTNQKNVSISFSSSDTLSGVASYQCSQNSAAYSTCTSPLNLTALADGAYAINVRALDQAGNMSAVASASFTVDSVLPVLAFTQSPVSSTAVTATFAFSSSDAGSGIQSVECSLDNAAFAVCVSPINLANLSVAAHNYRVQVKDKAGNMSLLSHNWTVSAVTPPPPPIDEIALGKTLYSNNCAQCHNPIATSTKLGRTAAQISAAITAVSPMNSLKSLTSAEVGYIAKALAPVTTPPKTSLSGLFIGVGYGGRKMVSKDMGKTWLVNTSDVASGGDDQYLFRGVNAANGVAVAVGFRINRTTDGINWTEQKLGQWLGGVVYGNNRWVAVGGCGLRMYSDDNAVTWKEIPNSFIGTNGCGHFRALTFGNGLFVANGDSKIKGISSDGINWQVDYDMDFLNDSMTFGNGLFYAISMSGQLISSTDAKSWVNVNGISGIDTVSFSNNTVFASGSGKIYFLKSGTTSWASVNSNESGQIFDNGANAYIALNWGSVSTSTNLTTWSKLTLNSNSLEAGVYIP